MGGKYEKFEIKMRREREDYRLWKKGQDEVMCFLETYKEKRSIFFSVTNLLPSSLLKAEFGMDYHLLLLGAEDGDMIHRDFGIFHVSQSGEGSFFQKFSGPAITCYTHCLLVTSKDNESVQIVYRGETPFFLPKQPTDLWHVRLAWCEEQQPAKVFSSDVDETGATWYRIPKEEDLPEALAPSKALIDKYAHYILGRCGEACYVGIPGRFLKREQPHREEGVFLLWQPLRGGEHFFERPEQMSQREAEEVFGYWIAEVDLSSGLLKSL